MSGGENIYPAEVENVLAKHPDVLDVAVIGVPDEKWGEAVKAVVVRKDGSEVTRTRPDHVRARAPRRLQAAEVGRLRRALPRNPSGKLLKRDIRAPYWEGANRQIR